MLKGVNRKVVEIQSPDSVYFEKAVFYLKPNMQDIPIRLLTLEARHCMHKVMPGRRRRRNWVLLLLPFFLSGIAVAGYLLFFR